jgi:hypothetical protein
LCFIFYQYYFTTIVEAAKHSSEALVSMQHIEEAVKKIRIQREMKPEEKMRLPQYGWFIVQPRDKNIPAYQVCLVTLH